MFSGEDVRFRHVEQSGISLGLGFTACDAAVPCGRRFEDPHVGVKLNLGGQTLRYISNSPVVPNTSVPIHT